VYSVFGVENPLMDIIAHVDFSYLQRLGKKPGTMNLVDYAEVELLMSGLPSCRLIPGGSCANTARGLAWLRRAGGIEPPVFSGAVGEDRTGDAYIDSITGAGVTASIVRKSHPTGVSLILVTPDGERTMNTHLGACRDFTTADLDMDRLSRSRLLHLTGYLWDTDNQKKAALAAAERARSAGIPIAFDIADPYAAQKYRSQFPSFISEYVDVLFANREELALLTQTETPEQSVQEAAALTRTVVMKTGKDGCIVSVGGKSLHVPAEKAALVDTTGAGDAFAAGYLYGYLRGQDAAQCARIANSVAARIVAVEGCDYSSLAGMPGDPAGGSLPA
jgi:sugar/nucleoside kinase (ribokinase family)